MRRARRLGGEFAGLWRRRGGDACARDGARADPHLPFYDRDIRAGTWHFESAGKVRRCSDMTLGIVGLGRIGKRMAYLSRNLFKRVIACDPYLIDGDFPRYVERRRSRRHSRRAT
jgi:hypothetical protein